MRDRQWRSCGKGFRSIGLKQPIRQSNSFILVRGPHLKADTKKQHLERARQRSNIESIEMSLERFNSNLSDARKVRLFSMNHASLKKLAIDVGSTQTRIKAISLIVAAIVASEEERERDQGTSSNRI